MQSHFVTMEFKTLWELVKSLVKTDDQSTFDNLWHQISTDPSVPPSFVKYFDDVWMKRPHMWSKVY